MIFQLLKRALCRHRWGVNYNTGAIRCKKCGHKSKKNYYHVVIGEKW